LFFGEKSCNEEALWFCPGDRDFPVFDIGPCKIGIMICFDWFFPESMRILSLKGADVICHSANLVLPFCQDAMVTRCLENHVFAITANRIGMENRGGKTFHVDNHLFQNRKIAFYKELLETYKG
jgi:predicted amidohydrolase